jgi:cellulose synthase operon protein C
VLHFSVPHFFVDPFAFNLSATIYPPFIIVFESGVMLLRFPTLDIIKLAITSGALPAEIAAAPVKAEFDEAGGVLIESSVKLPQPVRAGLLQLGAEIPWVTLSRPQDTLCSWFQIFPLTLDPQAAELSNRTAVLFDLAEPRQLPGLVAEILRLGNDRQSFCHVAQGEQVHALLRVVGPPYYSLLRALDKDPAHAPPEGVDGQPLRAFVERRPRVWIELGYSHPLAERIEPAPGQMLLIHGPRHWEFVDESPMQDVYQALECRLPNAETAWQPAELESRLLVPIRLVPGGNDAAELWVLGEKGAEQLDALVQASDDQLIARLAFAVGEVDGRRTIVLRARPSKLPPPVLVVDGLTMHPCLKLPNLFVPCGQRIHPPLRRSRVAEILAADPSRVVWLVPEADGRFAPQSLPDAAFRPLGDWVEYVIDCEHQALNLWIEGQHFDFESFVCRDDRREREEKPAKPKPAPAEAVKPREPRKSASPTAEAIDEEEITFTLIEDDDESPPYEPPAPTEREQLQKQLFEIEQQFLALDSPLDASDRAEFWQQMAQANAMLGHHFDAAHCCANAAWDDAARGSALLPAWEKASQDAAAGTWNAVSLDRILATNQCSPEQAEAVASGLVCAGDPSRRSSPEAALICQRQGPLARFLERHEGLLPARLAWLAWLAYCRLGGGDVLALARARDRALERLFEHGLRTDVDLPSFLRGLGRGDSQQVHMIRERLAGLQERVADWISEPIYKKARTRQYAGLMFCYGMARLGDTAACRETMARIEPDLGRDEIHSWTWEAFRFRIRQAMDGLPGRGELPAELLDVLEPMDRLARYKIDKLRQVSRILEPSLHIDAYRSWRQYRDEFSREVQTLVDVVDRDEAKARIEALLSSLSTFPDKDRVHEAESVLLIAALAQAPRFGDAFSRGLLERVMPLVQRNIGAAIEQHLLQRAIFVAAHFDRTDLVEAYLNRVCDHLQGQPAEGDFDSFALMLGECFRSLRKLGMRDEIGRLLARVSEAPLQSTGAVDEHLRLMLLAASGWLVFGQQSSAVEVLDRARKVLTQQALKPNRRVDLAQSYLSALGYAPAEFALPRVEELFASPDDDREPPYRLPVVSDAMTTNSHFSVFQLRIVEAVVLAVVSEEFTMNAESRRWLDEDEFLVRRRIHRDMKAAMAGK